MLVKIVKNEKYFMSDDFKKWIKLHQSNVFKIKSEVIGYDENQIEAVMEEIKK